MVEIIVIAAVADNNVIGKDGDIPWRIKEDFEHFKELTMGHPCIMGDITYESLPDNAKPLPGRENIVMTFDRTYNPPGTKIFYTWEDALEYVKDKNKVFICGGASIYKLGLEVADTLELTRVHRIIEEGDVFFPEIDFSEWKLMSEEKHDGFTFQTYRRRKKSN
jgi:dihydrofolate reductase